jgi:hypothetical protein
VSGVSWWETVLIYVVIPAGVFALIYAPIMTRNRRTHRYRPGQKWPYEPIWWTANPEGAGGHGESRGQAEGDGTGLIRTARGGARGSW